MPLSTTTSAEFVAIDASRGAAIVPRPIAQLPARDATRPWPASEGTFLAAILLIVACHVSLVVWGIVVHSPTISEQLTMVAGLYDWDVGRHDLYVVNPPLVPVMATAPVLLLSPVRNWWRLDRAAGARPEYDLAADFLCNNHHRAMSFFYLGRIACLPFTVIGALTCFVWARALYGRAAGIVALMLWSFSPTILAHAQLMTSDLPAASLAVAAGYCCWRWLSRGPNGNWPEALLAGTLMGLAALTKLTCLVLFVTLAAFWLVNRSRDAFGRRPAAHAPPLRQLIAVCIVGMAVVDLGYGFQGCFHSIGSYRFVSASFAGDKPLDERLASGIARFQGSHLHALAVPVPQAYIRGLDLQALEFEDYRFNYLRGRWEAPGHWYYYLYALGIKEPLGMWMLAIIALAMTLLPSSCNCSSHAYVLVAYTAAIVGVVSSRTHQTEHYRYVLPALGFTIVRISQAGHLLKEKLGPIRGAIIMLLTCAITSSLWSYPHTLSYFNELVGGPRRGPCHLLGSNVDSDQDLLYLKAWCETHRSYAPIKGLLSWRAPVLGVPCEPLPSDWFARPHLGIRGSPPHGAAEWCAVSVNRLYRDGEAFAFFRDLQPAASAGYSIYIYNTNLGDTTSHPQAVH